MDYLCGMKELRPRGAALKGRLRYAAKGDVYTPWLTAHDPYFGSMDVRAQLRQALSNPREAHRPLIERVERLLDRLGC